MVFGNNNVDHNTVDVVDHPNLASTTSISHPNANGDAPVASTKWSMIGLPHIFSSKATSKMVLKGVIVALVMTLVIFLLFVFILLNLLGSLWNPFQYLKNLNVVIVDHDQGVVGNFLSSNYSMYCPYNVINNPNIGMSEEEFVGGAKEWFALRIPAGFSDRLLGALNGTITSYSGSIDLLVDEGRSYLALIILEPLITDSVKAATDVLMRFVLSSTDLSKVKDTNVLLNPVTVNKIIIHPTPFFGEDIATGMLNVFIFILSTVITLFTTNVYMTQLFGKVNFIDFYLVKQAHNFLNAIVLSATVTVALTCWNVNFYASGGVYFLFYVLVLTVIQVIELGTYLFRQYTIVFALAFVILNFASSSALLMLEVQYPFFNIGQDFQCTTQQMVPDTSYLDLIIESGSMLECYLAGSGMDMQPRPIYNALTEGQKVAEDCERESC